MTARRPSQAADARLVDGVDSDDHEEQGTAVDVEVQVDGEPSSPSKISERFFIVKSLTLQDLEQSVQNGIWATQSHNEQTLNEAYHVS